MTRRALVQPVVRENSETPLARLLGADVAAGPQLARWRDRVGRIARRTQRDLRMRGAPFAVSERAGDAFLRVGAITGALSLPGLNLSVIPKFIGPGDEERWQASILTMLGRARRSNFISTPVHSLAWARSLTFLDHVALSFAQLLEHAQRREPIHRYRDREEEPQHVRGRLDIPRQLRQMFSRPGRLCCLVDYLDSDNDFNHLLRWTGERLSRRTFHPRVRRRLSRAIETLPALAGPPRLPAQLPLRVPRQYQHYADAIEVANHFARGESHALESADVRGHDYLLNMESLFEGFVERSIPKALALMAGTSWTSKPQCSRAFALPITESAGTYWSRPDNVISCNQSPVLVVDAKYKSLRDAEEGRDPKRPHNSDIYQLAAALVAHRCRKGLLLYPWLPSEVDPPLLPKVLRAWRVPLHGQSLVIGASAVPMGDLSSRERLGQFDEGLAGLLEQLVCLDPETESA